MPFKKVGFEYNIKVLSAGMVQKVNELIKPKPNYEIETLDQRMSAGVRATLTVINPDGSTMRYSRVAQNKGAAKRMCAEDALANLKWTHNYASICNHLCQVYIPYSINKWQNLQISKPSYEVTSPDPTSFLSVCTIDLTAAGHKEIKGESRGFFTSKKKANEDSSKMVFMAIEELANKSAPSRSQGLQQSTFGMDQLNAYQQHQIPQFPNPPPRNEPSAMQYQSAAPYSRVDEYAMQHQYPQAPSQVYQQWMNQPPPPQYHQVQYQQHQYQPSQQQTQLNQHKQPSQHQFQPTQINTPPPQETTPTALSKRLTLESLAASLFLPIHYNYRQKDETYTVQLIVAGMDLRGEGGGLTDVIEAVSEEGIKLVNERVQEKGKERIAKEKEVRERYDTFNLIN
jgi:hypothetical protein